MTRNCAVCCPRRLTSGQRPKDPLEAGHSMDQHSLLNLRMEPEASSTVSLDDNDALRTNDLEGLHKNRNDLQEECIFRQLLTSSITISLNEITSENHR